MHAQCTMYNTNMVCHATRRRPLPMVAWLKKGRKGARERREKGSCSLPLHVEASATTRGKSFFAATVGTK